MSGFGPGHPCYYHEGGKPLTPAEIKASVMSGDYRGYLMSEWDRIGAMPDGPARRKALAEAREKVERDLEQDLQRYAEICLELEQFRAFIGPHHAYGFYMIYKDPRTAAMLKHNHLFNAYANLRSLDGLERATGTQLELF